MSKYFIGALQEMAVGTKKEKRSCRHSSDGGASFPQPLLASTAQCSGCRDELHIVGEMLEISI